MKIIIVLLSILLLLESILLAFSLFLNTGFKYEPFKKFTFSDTGRNTGAEIIKLTCSYNTSAYEYELPYKAYVNLRSYVYRLRLYLCLDKLPFDMVERQYGGAGTPRYTLHIYTDDGESHTIRFKQTQKLFGKDFSIIYIDGMCYLTDYWYHSLNDLLEGYYQESYAVS